MEEQDVLKFYNSSTKLVFNDAASSDLKFIFHDGGKSEEIVYAHASLLFIECPKFYEKMIYGKPHGSCSITLENINVNLFKTFLEILYVGHSNQQLEFHQELIEFFKEYEMTNMENKLQLSLDNLTLGNVSIVLQKLIEYQAVDIKDRAMKFIRENYSALLKSKTVLETPEIIFTEIIKVDDILDPNFSEINVVDAVANYIEKNGDQQKIGFEKSRPFLNIIKCIRFPSMNHEDFARCIHKHKFLLTPEETVEIFVDMMNVAKQCIGFPDRARNQIEIQPIVETMELTFVEENNRNNGAIPKIRSIFSVNTAVVITDVYLYDNAGNKCEVSVKLFDPKRYIYANARGITNTSNRFSRSYTFDRLLVLQPDQNYYLDIEYERDSQYFYGVPKTNILKFKEVEIVFDVLNPMLRGFNLNIFDREK